MKEKLLDKIRKLIAHERSARQIGNVDEAAAFAARIQELLLKHEISLAEVESAAGNRDGSAPGVGHHFVDRGKYSAGETLLKVIAEAHLCKIIRWRRTTVILVGEEAHRVITFWMFDYLRSTMLRLARVEKARVRAMRLSVKLFTRSYHYGFVKAIYDRYQEGRAKADAASTALIRIGQAVGEYIEEKFKTKAASSRKQKMNSRAMMLGYAAGREVSLSEKVIS